MGKVTHDRKTAKNGFCAAVKPALNAAKRITANRRDLVDSFNLNYLDGCVNVKWKLEASKKTLHYRVGTYGVSVPVPACVDLCFHVEATVAFRAVDVLEKIIQAAQ